MGSREEDHSDSRLHHPCSSVGKGLQGQGQRGSGLMQRNTCLLTHEKYGSPLGKTFKEIHAVLITKPMSTQLHIVYHNLSLFKKASVWDRNSIVFK